MWINPGKKRRERPLIINEWRDRKRDNRGGRSNSDIKEKSLFLQEFYGTNILFS